MAHPMTVPPPPSFASIADTLKEPEGPDSCFLYASLLLEYLVGLKTKFNVDEYKNSFDKVLEELGAFFDYYTNEEHVEITQTHLTSHVARTMAKNYVLCFLLLGAPTSALFDTTNRLITGVVQADKKNTLYTHNSSQAKYIVRQRYLLIVLEQIYATYGYDLPSLAPIMVQYCYKSAKTIVGSLKTEHLSYADLTLLMRLLDIVLQNGGVVDSSMHSKLIKFAKSIIKITIDKDTQDRNSITGLNLAVEPVAVAFSILTLLIPSDKKYQGNSALFVAQLSKDYSSYLLMGLISPHSEVRRTTARALAGLLYKHAGLEDTLGFYTNFYISTDDVVVRSSLIMSLVHFLALQDAHNKLFLMDSFFPVLEAFKNVINAPLLSLNGYDGGRVLAQIQWFYRSFYLPALGQHAKSAVLQKLLDPEYLGNEVELVKSPVFVQVMLRIVALLIADMGPTISLPDQLQRLLLKLVTDRNFQVRSEAVNAFSAFCKVIPYNTQEILNECLLGLQTGFRGIAEQAKTDSGVQVQPVTDFGRLHGYAACVAFLIGNIDQDYVLDDVVARTLAFALVQLKASAGPALTSLVDQLITDIQLDFNKRLVSWMLLAGVMRTDMAFLRMHVPQFFVFWKKLLTHSYQPTLQARGASELRMAKARMEEVFRNLETRNYALTCLLLFLSHKISPSTASQAAGLLSRCLAHVTTLESNLTKMGAREKEETYDSDKESVLYMHKKRILQCYMRLLPRARAELDSAVVVFCVRSFLDPDAFTTLKETALSSTLKDKEKDKEKEMKIHKIKYTNKEGVPISDDLDNRDLWLVTDGIAYGVTSKIAGNDIGKLCVSNLANSNEIAATETSWPSLLESVLFSPFCGSASNDYLLPLYDHTYLAKFDQSVGLKTAVVDLAIEAFLEAFTQLLPKIQQLLLEQLRGHVMRKGAPRFRMKAVAINTCVALHAMLTRSESLSEGVLLTLLETLKVIDLKEQSLFAMNCQSIALALAQMSRSVERIDIHINDIVSNEKPYARAADAVVLAGLYRRLQTRFSEICEVLMALARDPHPVVHFWAAHSLARVMDAHVTASPSVCLELLELIGKMSVNDDFFWGKGLNTLAFLNRYYFTRPILARVLRNMVILIGPNISALKPRSRALLSSLLHIFLFVDNEPEIIMETLLCLQNLTVFDKTIFASSTYICVLDYLFKNSLKTGMAPVWRPMAVLNKTNELYPITTSKVLLDTILGCFSQLVRTAASADALLARDTRTLLWACVENAHSEDAQFVVRQWFDALADVRWFSVLSALYRAPRTELDAPVRRLHQQIELQHEKKEVKVDLQDEEIESMAKTTDKDTPEEPTSHMFKLFVLSLVRELLAKAKVQHKLHLQMQPRVQDAVKMAFSAATCGVLPLRMEGIALLGDIIAIYGKDKDPLYENVSLLEQQQAQITAALTPAFTAESTPLLAAAAVEVCAQFVGLGIVSIDKCGRILRILESSLEGFLEKKEARIGEVPILTPSAQKRVQLAVLNAWAGLKICGREEKETSPELDLLVDKYLDILVPMWVLLLREYLTVKGGSEVQFFAKCWANFVDVVGCVVEENEAMLMGLLGEDAPSFFFVLFAQCIEKLMGEASQGTRVATLSALRKLLALELALDVLFQPQVFSETVDLFDRLVLVLDDAEKALVVDVIEGLFLSFFRLKATPEEFTANVDKLFELLRVVVLAIGSLLPFVADESQTLKKPLSETQISLSRKLFSAVVTMIGRFPDVMKVDLYACVLTIIARVYCDQHARELAYHLLGHVKSIVTWLALKHETALTSHFYRAISKTFSRDTTLVLTLTVLVTCGVSVAPADCSLLVSGLVEALLDRASLAIAIQSIKGLILYSLKEVENQSTIQNIMKKLVPELVTLLVENKDKVEDPRLVIEMLVLYAKQFKQQKEFVSVYSIILPLVCWYDSLLGLDAASGQFKQYLHLTLLNLLNLSTDSFKIVVNEVLSDAQKKAAEGLVKFDLTAFNRGGASGSGGIELKRLVE